MNRRGHKGRVDENHAEVKQAFEALGCTVVSLAPLGDGVGDLLVGCDMRNYMVEVKAGDKKLTPDETRFCRNWRGHWQLINDAQQVPGAVREWRRA